jgi:hypothetical protein
MFFRYLKEPKTYFINFQFKSKVTQSNQYLTKVLTRTFTIGNTIIYSKNASAFLIL